MELADLPKHFLSRSGAQCVWVAGEGAGRGKIVVRGFRFAWSVGKTDGSSFCSGLFSCLSCRSRVPQVRIFVMSAPVPVLGLISCVCRDRRRHQGIRTGVPAVDV